MQITIAPITDHSVFEALLPTGTDGGKETAALTTRERKRRMQRAVRILVMIICGICAVMRQRLKIPPDADSALREASSGARGVFAETECCHISTLRIFLLPPNPLSECPILAEFDCSHCAPMLTLPIALPADIVLEIMAIRSVKHIPITCHSGAVIQECL